VRVYEFIEALGALARAKAQLSEVAERTLTLS
jgi:hypothetical protein